MRKRERRRSSGANCCPDTSAAPARSTKRSLATYMSGANSRRIRKALKPLLGDEHLSKSAVSRVVSRLKERFEEWQSRELSDGNYAIVFLDGFLCLLFIHPRAPNLINLRSASTMLA